MLKRIPQPPIDLARRSREERPAWIGSSIAGLALLLAVIGLVRLTRVETVDENLALEPQVNLAFAHGGVRMVHPKVEMPSIPGAPPWMPGDPPLTVAGPQARLRGSRLAIDLTAKDPCPT
jgi:hypothetical protein